MKRNKTTKKAKTTNASLTRTRSAVSQGPREREGPPYPGSMEPGPHFSQHSHPCEKQASRRSDALRQECFRNERIRNSCGRFRPMTGLLLQRQLKGSSKAGKVSESSEQSQSLQMGGLSWKCTGGFSRALLVLGESEGQYKAFDTCGLTSSWVQAEGEEFKATNVMVLAHEKAEEARPWLEGKKHIKPVARDSIHS